MSICDVCKQEVKPDEPALHSWNLITGYQSYIHGGACLQKFNSMHTWCRMDKHDECISYPDYPCGCECHQLVIEYAELARLVTVGAYQERQPDGSYGEDGIERRLDELNEWAIQRKMVFVPRPKGAYELAPATPEMVAAYEEAVKERRNE